MARARNIKPGFYKNEDLAECSIWARFIFPGLWMMADRDGRLEDRPKRIKAELLPFDAQEVEPLLVELVEKRFIIRYEAGGLKIIQISKFYEHQSPHYSEKASVLLPPQFVDGSRKDGGIKEGSQPPDSLNPDSLNPESLQRQAPSAARVGAGLNGRRIDFDFKAMAFKGITEADELRWQDAYPAVPIPPEISKAAAWLAANPANRKKNYERFLVNWFGRSQDRAVRVKR